jgi:2-polyprenyl-6-methoxyphenol hydroxylase-like FAD-dependent oxidoreductase
MERFLARPRALIVGGSVGGLFAANLLRGIGCDVLVLERATGDLGDRGTGIGTRDELFAVMCRIGLPVAPSIGVAVRGRIGLDPAGHVIGERPVPAITSAWSRIWRPLRQALPAQCYRGGAAVVRVEPSAVGVTTVLADGSAVHGDLLVAADGLHSTVRTQLAPRLKPNYAGYVAWRGVVEERQLASELRDLMFHHMVFGFPDGELAISLPMPGPDEGLHRDERRCHFVWFRPVTQSSLAGLCTDSVGRQHGVSIPPPLIRPELLETVRSDADRQLPPQLAALVGATSQIILQPIFDLESSQLAFGRIAVLGDAAFVARPHVASGVMKAALDAQVLADVLAVNDDVEAALAGYDRKRRPFGSWLVARGRRIGATIAERGAPTPMRADTLMREYGAAGVVEGESISAGSGG